MQKSTFPLEPSCNTGIHTYSQSHINMRNCTFSHKINTGTHRPKSQDTCMYAHAHAHESALP